MTIVSPSQFKLLRNNCKFSKFYFNHKTWLCDLVKISFKGRLTVIFPKVSHDKLNVLDPQLQGFRHLPICDHILWGRKSSGFRLFQTKTFQLQFHSLLDLKIFKVKPPLPIIAIKTPMNPHFPAHLTWNDARCVQRQSTNTFQDCPWGRFTEKTALYRIFCRFFLSPYENQFTVLKKREEI